MTQPANPVAMYAWMRLTRVFDETMVAMWKSGRGVGGAFSCRGHEAISVGVGMALGPQDVVAPMHRDLGTYLVRGMGPERIFGNLLGKATGTTRGRDSNLHGMGDLDLGIIGFVSHIPQSLPTTLGVAMAFLYRGEPRVAVTFVGDGSASSGGFHETLNMAALWKAPYVLILENNQYAYSTPLSQQTAQPDFASKAAAYGMPGVKIDGNDAILVHEVVSEAIERARAGEGPTLIQADTMRMLGHAIHDGAEYVPAQLLRDWEKRDPVVTLRARLIEMGAASPDQLDAIDAQATERIAQAVKVAEAAPLPNPSEQATGVYA